MSDPSMLDKLLDQWDDMRASGSEPDLAELCRATPELLPQLRERVEAFLKMDQAMHRAVDSSDAGLPEAARSSSAAKSFDVACGTSITSRPQYRIQRPHARGGIGEVLVAEDRQLQRTVAIKRMRAGTRSDSARLQRFQREAVITGQLDHPGIVPILSLGEDEHGDPFYAMKFIEGTTLADRVRQLHDEFAGCQATGSETSRQFESLVLRPLLSRFVSVCNTIAYAHSRNIIHRDLKPANIMLGEFGATYVVDWGLARQVTTTASQSAPADLMATILADDETIQPTGSSTDDDSGFATDTLTRTGAVMGTPAFMSPEQAMGKSAEIGPASDIYSLGATLWFLLAGRAAITSSGDMSWLEQLKSGTVPRPSSVQRLVPASLESICLKAMQRDPAARYGSATELGLDTERWLADEPISIARETVLDRFARFTRHHRAASLTILIASALLAVTATVAGVLINAQKNVAVKAEGETRKAAIAETAAKEAAVLAATAERVANEQAQRRLAQVERANGALASIFENLDPQEVAKNEEPLHVLLVRQIEATIAELNGDSIGDPLVVAEIQNKLGKSLLSLSEPARAIPVLQQALATHITALGKSHVDTMGCQMNLADAFQQSGDFTQCIPMMEEALALCRASMDDSAARKSDVINHLGSAYLESGKIPEAIELFQEALSLRKEHQGLEHPATVASMNDLAMGYSAAGRRDEALVLLKDVARLTETLHGPDDPRTLSGANNLAIALFSGGQLRESLPLFEDTLKRRRLALGREHIDTLGSMNNLAANYQALSMWTEAMALLEEAEALTAKKFGEKHPGHLFTINNLGFVYMRMGQLEKAVPVMERTLALRLEALGDDHPDTHSARLNLGMAQVAAGRTDTGLSLLEAAFVGRLSRLGIDHLKTLEALVSVTDAFEKAARPADAERLFLQAMNSVPDDQRQNSATSAQIGARLGSLFLRQARWSDAEPLLTESFRIRQSAQPDAATTFSTQSMLGEAMMGQKQFDQAEPLLLSSLQGLQDHPHTNPQQHAQLTTVAIERIIRLYESTDRPDKALEWRTRLSDDSAASNPGSR